MEQSNPFEGCYRRLIDLQAWDDHTVVGWLEDDLHHFGLTLIHDGQGVTGIRGAALRHPWTTCPGALGPITDLIGKPLLARSSDVGQQIEMRAQCTHLFDLAGLLSAHAFHGRLHRRYHATVQVVGDDKRHSEHRRAQLWQDDELVMSWELAGGVIQSPPRHKGHSMERGFRPWTESLAVEEAEQAGVLRRAVFVSGARFRETRISRIPDLSLVPVVCHSYQPDIRGHAQRDEASREHRFDHGPQGMLSWVASKP